MKIIHRIMASAAALAALAIVVPASAQTYSTPEEVAFREIFRELIETRSSVSGGECTLAAERMAARLWAAGYPASDAQVLVPDSHPKEGALVAVLRGSDPTAPALLLLAHIDVVEARREDWTRDPFVLVEEDGYFYGRGTQDDKAQAAIWIDTLIRLRHQGFQPRRDIKVALTCGEETSTAFNTVSWLLENHPETLRAGMALNEDVRARLNPDGTHVALEIMVGEKVYQDFQLETTHPGGHSSRPVPDNAIYQLSAGLTRLGAHRFPIEINQTTRAYFAAMADLAPANAADMRAVSGASPDLAAAERLGAADPIWNSMMRTTCVATQLEGGHASNALPQRAWANVNCRILPGYSAQDVQVELERVIADPRIVVTTRHAPDPVSPAPPLTPQFLEPIQRVAARMWPGVAVVPSMNAGASDARFTNAAGIPTYGVTGLFAHPDGGGVHGLNERIRIRSLYQGRDFLFDLVKIYADQP